MFSLDEENGVDSSSLQLFGDWFAESLGKAVQKNAWSNLSASVSLA